MKTAIIHFEPCFSKRDQGIFLRKTLKKIKYSIKSENHEILLYKIPVYKEKPSNKAIEQFILYLRKEQIEKIILSKEAEILPCSELIKKYFSKYDGSTVINHRVYDILRKYAKERNINLSESTVILCLNQPEILKNIILKIYRYVKKIKVLTEKPELFNEMTNFFLYEYGLYIELIQIEGKKENEIVLNLNEIKNYDIIFSSNNKLRELEKLLCFNQKTIEFIIENFYGSLKADSISTFFYNYPMRIVKIKNND